MKNESIQMYVSGDGLNSVKAGYAQITEETRNVRQKELKISLNETVLVLKYCGPSLKPPGDGWQTNRPPLGTTLTLVL